MTRYFKPLFAAIILLLSTSTQGAAQQKGKITTYKTQKFEKKLKKAKNPQLIDVRTVEEYAEGHLPHATNYNVMDSTLQKHLADLNPKKPVFVYCRSGVRSMKAAELLKSNGFKVINLENGTTGWKENNFPLETDRTEQQKQ